ncbi:MAG: ZIP family metal transporter [Methanomassiliicoccales archaeon]|jgi:zinc and cadmium transporter|nr:ZIP family metal transporter [Methanomassiliicoccales archaeon]
MSAWIYAIASVILVSLISIIGILFLMLNDNILKTSVFILVGLAVGALFTDAFVHLIPEAFEEYGTGIEVPIYIIAGIFAFFVLEKFLHWRHEHSCEFQEICKKPVGYINMVSDGVHNLIDGILIGVSYLAGFEVGIATTIAIVLHEIPQEIGDFGILVYAGFTKWKALLFNFLAATAAIAGAIASLIIGESVSGYTTLMLPLAAGGFIYIAGSDLVPEMHKELNIKKSIIQMISIIIGVLVILSLAFLE